MFIIEDTSRSLTVALLDKGHAIASDGTWFRTGLLFDDCRSHVERLNRIAADLPDATAEQLFGLYYASHFLAADIRENGVASLLEATP